MPDVEAAASSAKKRGRTPKSPAPAAAGEESGEPVVKRGRGRPKGSKSTKKKEAAPKPTGPKRPRGRPKGSVKKKPEATDKSATPKKSPKKASEWWKFLSFTPERLQPVVSEKTRYGNCYLIYLYTPALLMVFSTLDTHVLNLTCNSKPTSYMRFRRLYLNTSVPLL